MSEIEVEIDIEFVVGEQYVLSDIFGDIEAGELIAFSHERNEYVIETDREGYGIYEKKDIIRKHIIAPREGLDG